MCVLVLKSTNNFIQLAEGVIIWKRTNKQEQIQNLLMLNFKKEIKPDTPEVFVDVIIEGDVSYHKIRTGDVEHASVICTWTPNE